MLQLTEIIAFTEFLKFLETGKAGKCPCNVCPGLVTSVRTFYDTAEPGRPGPSLALTFMTQLTQEP